MSAACVHCDDTGSLSKSMAGFLDCAECDVASDRAALRVWANENLQRGMPKMVAAWQLYQHGKASAIPPGYKLVKIEPEWDSLIAAANQNLRNFATLKGRLHTFNTLTDTQHRVLLFIKAYISSHGRPPTRQDIATHFNWKSPNAANDHLNRIAAKGFIVIHPGRACGIEVVSQLSTQHQQGQ